MPIIIDNGNNTSIIDIGEGNYLLLAKNTNNLSSSIIYVESKINFTFNLDWQKTNTNDSTNNDRIFWYVGNSIPTYDKISSCGNGDSSSSILNENSLSYYGWNNFNTMNYNITSLQSGSQSITVTIGQYIAVMICANSVLGTTFQISNFPNADGTCFIGTTTVLLENGKYKFIKDIKPNDILITDIKTNKKNKVIRLIKEYIITEAVKIPIGLLNNNEELICSSIHPIWINNDKDRILAKDIEGVEIFHTCDYFYNLQFEDENTFYVSGIKVDSISPYHHKYYLPKELYFDLSKYIGNICLVDENDIVRKKPLLKYGKQKINFD